MAIKPTEFEFKDSRWQDLYTHLKNKGYEVYAPAMHPEECIEPYLVVKNDGTNKHTQFSSNREQYTIYICVPRQRYSELEPLVQSVKKDMKELYPMFMQYDNLTLPSFYDDTVKAHYATLEYENYKKIEFM